MEHAVAEVAVVGVPDQVYGEKIAALVVLEEGVDASSFTVDRLNEMAKHKMARYKLPHLLLVVGEIPKKAMGKMAKKSLVRVFEKSECN